MVINMEDGLEEEQTTDKQNEEEEEEVEDPGTTEPPPSPLNESKEDLKEEEDEREEPRESEENSSEGKANEQEDPDTKPRSRSSVSASEETIQLARQLSECLNSPLLDDTPSLVPNDSKEVDRVPENILFAWLPSPVVQAMLASGRKVPPEQLTQPGLIFQTEKVARMSRIFVHMCFLLQVFIKNFYYCTYIIMYISFIRGVRILIFLLLQCDPIADILASTFPGTLRRQQVSVDQVRMDEEGLHILLVRQKL